MNKALVAVVVCLLGGASALATPGTVCTAQCEEHDTCVRNSGHLQCLGLLDEAVRSYIDCFRNND